MNQNEFDAELIRDIDALFAEDYVFEVDADEEESSPLTWDDEIVRDAHRDIAGRARRAAIRRLGW